MTNSKTPLVVEARKEIHAFSFSPTFKFNSLFYSSLRRVYRSGSNPWKENYGRSLITAFKTQNPVEYKSKRFGPLFPIHYKTMFHKLLNDGAIYEKDLNKDNFNAFIESHNFYNPCSTLDLTLYVEPQIQILRMINSCYSWHLDGQPESEFFKKNLCDELDALLSNPENHRAYPFDGFDEGSNRNSYFTHIIDIFLRSIGDIGESSPVSDLQKLTIELMMDINLAFIKLLEDKHGTIKPDYSLDSIDWLNWEELSKYFNLLPSYEDKKGKYFKVDDVIDSLNCFINNYMVEQVTNRELAGTDYNYSLGRIIYWHNFKYDQKTAQDMHQLGSSGLGGNDLFNIYCCYWPEFVELKKLNHMQSMYPYFYDAVSANYIRTVRPDFEKKLNQMAQLLDWESHRKHIVESFQRRISDAKETIDS